MNIIQLYEWYPVNHKIKTVNGVRRYEDWIKAEADRLRLPGRHVEIKYRFKHEKEDWEHEKKECGLFVNDLCMVKDCRKSATRLHWCEKHAVEFAPAI